MVKTTLTLAVLSILFSCAPDDGQRNKDDIPSPVPAAQQRIFNEKSKATEIYDRSQNDIKKSEQQTRFYKWIESYFRDTLKGEISGFYVTLSQLKVGQLPNTYYLYADFKTDDKLHLKVEEDMPTVEAQKNAKLYSIMKQANENQKLHLFAKFRKIDDPDAIDRDLSSLNYPTITVVVDSIKN